uniref:Membrane protein n=1 Tax=Marseillevirus LCMAC102 TaxID=2506603 RepID=A0A481YSY5_9VIRU|nr:MAG: membrane protein [Marseillevirus LCMAC102]
MSVPFSSKIDKLQAHVEVSNAKAANKEKCVPIMLIVGIIVPLLIFLLLYFLQPSFVQKKEGTKYIRNNTKLFYWTLLITVVLWIAMYLFSYCKGYEKSAMLCRK